MLSKHRKFINSLNIIRKCRILIIINIYFLITFGIATEYSWSRLGPPGGDINVIEIDPTNELIIYAGTNSGLFVSTDGGNSWNLQTSFPSINIQDVKKDYINNILFVASKEFGIYKSYDNGLNWIEINNGLPNKSIANLSISYDGSVMYAILLYAGIYRSFDEGDNWDFFAFDNLSTTSILINPDNFNTLYISTIEDGIYKSINGGNSWEKKNNGLIKSNINNYDILTTKLNPLNSNIIYAGASGFLNTSSIYVSTDSGDNWSVLNSEFLYVKSLIISPNDTDIIYAGTYMKGLLKSEDSGNSWITINNFETNFEENIPRISTLSLLPIKTETLFTGILNEGIYRTNNGGENWVFSSNGISNGYSTVLEISDQQPLNIYASSRTNLWKSEDDGSSWKKIKDFSLNTLAIHPTNPDILYAGTSNNIGTGNIMKSIDGGDTWTIAYSAPSSITSIKIDQESNEIIYAGYSKNEVSSGGILKSSNSGNSWDEIYLGEVGVSTISIDPNNNNRVYAGTDKGLFISNNKGSTWINISLFTDFVKKIVIDPKFSNILYVLTDNGLKKSTDRGFNGSFMEVKIGNVKINDIILDEFNSNRIFIGTESKGIFYSNNRGFSWLQFYSGLENLSVLNILIHPQNRTIVYASSNGGGILKIEVNDSLNIKSSDISFSLSQNYPNPFTSSTYITLTIQHHNDLNNSNIITNLDPKLIIYNILGQRIKTLVISFNSFGEQSILWDGTNDKSEEVTNGIYFCVLKGIDDINVIKMIKLK
jgi:photosystem II stability/assembly factor-like uncharacterized protein